VDKIPLHFKIREKESSGSVDQHPGGIRPRTLRRTTNVEKLKSLAQMYFAIKKFIFCQEVHFCSILSSHYHLMKCSDIFYDLPCDLPCAASLAGIQPVRPRAQRTSP